VTDGVSDGAVEGMSDGLTVGVIDGVIVGTVEGTKEGITEDVAVGVVTKAYTLKSCDPTYTVPSDPIAGLAVTQSPVVYFQRILPHDANAYTL